MNIEKTLRRIYRKIFPREKYGWFGNYASWNEAKRECTGYDAPGILKKVRTATLRVKRGEVLGERDSINFDQIQYCEPLLDALKEIVANHNHELNIVDFGGSLGSSYFQNKTALQTAKIKWAVVEQPHFVKCGKKHIQDDFIKFHYTAENAITEIGNQVLLLSGVIGYVESPYKLLDHLINLDFEYIIIDRTAFIDHDAERITKQIVPKFIYKASYPAWFLNEKKFTAKLEAKYVLVREFESKIDPRERLEDGAWSYRKGFVFRKRQSCP